MSFRFFACVFALVSLAGCAVADGDVDGVAPGRRDTGGGAEEEDDTGSSSVTDSGNTDSGSSGTDTGGSSGGDTGGSSGEDTGGSTTPCTALTSAECTGSAEIMTSISGDKGGTASASGTDSKWLRIKITEDDSSIFSGKDLRALVTLTSTGANFDLYVYMGKTIGDGGGVECSTLKSSSTQALGSPDVVALAWSDNQPIGGHDDGRFISIEVRGADSSCAGASWTLTVEGNK